MSGAVAARSVTVETGGVQPEVGLRERKKARMRQQIIDTSIKLFRKHGYEATRIDDFQRAAAPFRLAVDAVTGNAGLVGDNGAARTGQTVEERGLAHVGAADDDKRWESFGHWFLGRTHNGRSGVVFNLPM